MHMQKSEDYVDGKLFRSNEVGELFSSVICFMIVGLKNNVPVVIKSISVTRVDSSWLKEELMNQVLHLNGVNFKVE